MRTTLYPLLAEIARIVDVAEPVVEFGAYRVAEQSAMPPASASFPGKDYLGTDVRPGPGVSTILDLHDLDLPDASVGTALVLDVLEHVRDPARAMAEVARCLAPGGLVVITSVFYFPIHHTPDHWRFTSSAFDELLKNFDRSATATAGPARLPHTVVGLGACEPFDEKVWTDVCAAMHGWTRKGATTWKERAMMSLPPALLVRGYTWYEGRARGRAECT